MTGVQTCALPISARAASPAVAWKSAEFTDGPDGKEGGLGILRSGAGAGATMLLMKYGVHGQGHGHFDKLHFILFDGGTEARRSSSSVTASRARSTRCARPSDSVRMTAISERPEMTTATRVIERKRRNTRSYFTLRQM